MAETLEERIRPGSVVACGDGPVGWVHGLEPGAGDGPGSLRIRRSGETGEVLVPTRLVREVGADGTVRLACRRDDLGRLADGAETAVAASDEPMVRADDADVERTVELREEELVPRETMREVGEVVVRKEVEEVPRRIETEAYREDVVVEHVPIGRVVREREGTRQEGDVLIVPVYEEQLVVTKRLVLREELHIRREPSAERQVFEDTVRRERMVIDEAGAPGHVRERFPEEEAEHDRGEGFLEKLGRKVLR